jgi:hypothetical protein
MDALSASIVTILGKYALDKGVELGKEVGPKALDTAKEMFTVALDHLRGNPDGEVIARKFEQKPQAYEKSLEDELGEAVQTDPEFASKLQKLLAQYDAAAKEHAKAAGTTYNAALNGSGAIAQGDGATALGAGALNIGGNVQGGIIVTGDNNTVGRGDKEHTE